MDGLWICQGYTWFRVICILKILSILNVLSSEYARVLNVSGVWVAILRVLNKVLQCIYLTGFWIYHGFKMCQGSEYIRVLNMSGFIKKTLHHIDAWQSTDYSSGSAYTRVLNMPGLHKVLKKMLHHRCLTGFQIFLRFWTCHGSKYARVTQGTEQKSSIIDVS